MAKRTFLRAGLPLRGSIPGGHRWAMSACALGLVGCSLDLPEVAVPDAAEAGSVGGAAGTGGTEAAARSADRWRRAGTGNSAWQLSCQ